MKLTKIVQQLVLAAATFDKDNKILVTASGNLPLRKLTEAWLEQVSKFRDTKSKLIINLC